MKTLIERDDRAAVARMVRFPIDVSLDGELDYSVRNAAEFVSLFPRIFHPGLVWRIRATRDDDIFCNWWGILFGDCLILIQPGKGPDVTIDRICGWE